MNSVDVQIDTILRSLPNWSATIDPDVKVDYASLKASAVAFLEALPGIREQYRVDAQSLVEVQRAGLPAPIVAVLKTLDDSKIFGRKELVDVVNKRLAGKLHSRDEALILKHTEIWRTKLKEYSDRYCFPKFQPVRASGFYVFLRTIFKAPTSHPIGNARVFGGWIHPSASPDATTFDLSWPVELQKDGATAAVHPYDGYHGKGYDGIGEYDYFLESFPFRDAKSVKSLVFESF